MGHFENVYLENQTRDILVLYFSPFALFLFNPGAFDTVDSIHSFEIIELFVLSFQCRRSVGTGNVFIASFAYASIIFGESSQPSE